MIILEAYRNPILINRSGEIIQEGMKRTVRTRQAEMNEKFRYIKQLETQIRQIEDEYKNMKWNGVSQKELSDFLLEKKLVWLKNQLDSAKNSFRTTKQSLETTKKAYEIAKTNNPNGKVESIPYPEYENRYRYGIKLPDKNSPNLNERITARSQKIPTTYTGLTADEAKKSAANTKQWLDKQSDKFISR